MLLIIALAVIVVVLSLQQPLALPSLSMIAKYPFPTLYHSLPKIS
jgi:hypothetical protein